MTAVLMHNAAATPRDVQAEIIRDTQRAYRLALHAPDCDVVALHRDNRPNLLTVVGWSERHGWTVHTVRFHPERSTVTFHGGYYAGNSMDAAVDEYLRRTDY